MAMHDGYRRQVALLVQVLPAVAEEKCFALKGGTAINLFVRDLPRLSVDIDLTYLPVSDRTASLAAIEAALKRISTRIQKQMRGAKITTSGEAREKTVTKLLVRHQGVQVKIEVTPVLRGCVYEPELRPVSPKVEDEFGFAEMQVVSFADLYAGKIVAALDRQHPRDLFDVRDLLANEGIDEPLRRAFVVYLLSHNRPMAEILAPARKDISKDFRHGFDGMTSRPVEIGELIAAREELIASIAGKAPETHRQFLLSFKRGEPDWSLLDVPGAAELPAVRWRQQNLATLPQAERERLAARLEAVWAGAGRTRPAGG